MTTLTLPAPLAYSSTPSGWSDISNVFDGNGATFATIAASGNMNFLGWDEFTSIDDLRNPIVQIDHINLELVAEATSASILRFKFYIGDTLYTATRSMEISTNGTYSVHFAKDTTGLGLDQLALSKQTVKLNIESVGNHTVKIYTLDINVVYTTSNNSVGTKSYYPSTQEIPLVYGASSTSKTFEPNYVIQSDQYNRLADDIILTQKLLLLDAPTLTELGDGLLVIGLDSQGNSDRLLFNFILKATSNSSGLPSKYSKALDVQNGAVTLSQDFSSYWTSWSFQTSALPEIAVGEEFYFPFIMGGGYSDPYPTTSQHTYVPLAIGGGCGYFQKTATTSYKTLLKFNIIPNNFQSPQLEYNDSITWSKLWNTTPTQKPELITPVTVPNIKNFSNSRGIENLNYYQIRILAIGMKQ